MGHINSQIVSVWMAGSGRGGRFRMIAIPILGSSSLLLLLHIREYFKKLKIYQSDFSLLYQGVGSRSCSCGTELSSRWSLARSYSPCSAPLRGGGAPNMHIRREIPRQQNLEARFKSRKEQISSLQESFLPPFPKGGSVGCSSEQRCSW